MKGYLARETGCCGTTSVFFGLYSSMDMLCASNSAGERAKKSLCMDGMFFKQCEDALAHFFGETEAIARTRLGRWNRIANAHGDRACLNDTGAKRQNFARSLQRDRNQRYSCLDCDERGAFLEIAGLTVARAAAFGKNEQGDSFFPHDVGGERHGFHRGASVFPRDADVSGAPEMPAEERNLEEATLGEKAETYGDTGESHRRVHVAQMVRDENIAAVFGDLFESFYPHFDTAD